MRIISLIIAISMVLSSQGNTREMPSAVSLKGAVARPGMLDAKLTLGLPTYHRMVKIAGPNGQYRCAMEVEGYALKDILDRVEVRKKVDDGFNRPLDMFIEVKGRDGSRALLSYGEAFLVADGGPLLVDKSRLILPHHHDPMKPGSNDPTLLRSVAERSRADLQSCASCHHGAELPPLSLPRGWLLVVPQDGFGGRFVEDVVEVTVQQVGISVKDARATAKTAMVENPSLVAPGGSQTTLTPERFQQVPQQTWQDATFGMGKGFHGYHRWQGADLGALVRSLLPAGTDPSKAWVLATGADGYRCLFSGSEIFAAPEGRGIMLANRDNGEILAAGFGRFEVVPKADFYVDRSVHMVKEIRVGLMP